MDFFLISMLHANLLELRLFLFYGKNEITLCMDGYYIQKFLSCPVLYFYVQLCCVDPKLGREGGYLTGTLAQSYCSLG